MISGLWGRKIGMTQVFSDDQKVVPVTVIDLARWVVTQVKTQARDGYDAVQLGCVKKRYVTVPFSAEWLKVGSQYFSVYKEVRLSAPVHFDIGQEVDALSILSEGSVDAFGISAGRGFQGGVKRHGFTGGVASHGSKLGRGPGSIGYMRSQGRVIKGTRMAGHMGIDTVGMQNLKIVKFDAQAQVVLIKGSVPGKTGSLIFLRKRNR